MKTALVIILAVVVEVALVLFLIRTIYREALKRTQARVRARFKPEEVVHLDVANLFGILSRGGKQIRGNGALVLTRDSLYFLRAVPAAEFVVPLTDISAISFPRSFNRKSVFSELLRVDYTREGSPEAMAWAVRNPAEWKERIERLSGRTMGPR